MPWDLIGRIANIWPLALCPIAKLEVCNKPFNPNTAGGGPLWPPPRQMLQIFGNRREPRYTVVWLFPFKTRPSFDTLFAKIGHSVKESCDISWSHVCSKIEQFHYLCTKHMENTVCPVIDIISVILSFRPYINFLLISHH